MIGYGLEAFVDMVASILVRSCCSVARTRASVVFMYRHFMCHMAQQLS